MLKIKRFKIHLSNVVILVGTITALISSHIFAQAIEEVIVTAQKRAESIQDVPISMTALSGENIKEWGLGGADDLVNFIPNMSYIGSEATNINNIYLRGVGDFSFHVNQVGGVGVYVDDVSMSSPILQNFALLDLERIEVLRGPQNTLFGRNTTGGAIQFLARKPVIGEESNGYLRLTGGNEERFDGEGAFSAALGENSAMRVALSRISRGDYIDNLNTGNGAGGYERYSGRAQLLWAPTDNLEVLLNFHGGKYHGDSIQIKAIGAQDPVIGGNATTNCTIFTGDLGNGCASQEGTIDTADVTEVFGGNPSTFDTETYGGSVNIKWDLGAVEVVSITAFESAESQKAEDADAVPSGIGSFHQTTDTSQFSEEVRIISQSEGTFRWIAGLSYYEEEGDYTTNFRTDWVTDPAIAPFPAVFVPFIFIPEDRFSRYAHTVMQQDVTYVSPYLRLDYDLSDKLSLSGGVRFSYEKKEGNYIGALGFDDPANPFPTSKVIGIDELAFTRTQPGAVNIGQTDFKLSSSTWGGKISADYQITEDAMVYGSIARGFKAGNIGLAASDAINGFVANPVDPEFLWAYELGLKSQWLENSLRINVALFFNQWDDMQLSHFTNTAIGPATILTNVAGAETYGAEFDIIWYLAEGWSVLAGLGLLNAEVTDPGTLITVEKGDKLLNAPDLTFNGVVRKEWPVANGTFSLQTVFRYTDDVELDLSNLPEMREDGYWILNASARYRFGPEENYEVSVWGKNVTGTQYCLTRHDVRFVGFGNNIECFPNEGTAFYGVTASYNF